MDIESNGKKFLIGFDLNDNMIVEALKKAVVDYENGEISEVQDVLIEIINAIDEFECMEGFFNGL